VITVVVVLLRAIPFQDGKIQKKNGAALTNWLRPIDMQSTACARFTRLALQLFN